MPTAKDLHIAPISSGDANAFVKAHHYSGKAVNNSQLHLGVFLESRLHGVMQFGPSLDKRKIQGLVSGTKWHEFLELNRMAFDDVLPRNSESRALAIAFRLLRKNAPQVKWVVSFADGTQCGDGAIYRAAGFVLTAIKDNSELWQLSDGRIIHAHTLDEIHSPGQRGEEIRQAPRSMEMTNGASSPRRYIKALGLDYKILQGFQLRYIYFIDPTYRARLTVPELPYSEIEKREAGMYKGIKRERSIDSDAATFPVADGGASPTRSLLESTD